MQIKINQIKFSSIKFDGHKLMRQAHNQARIWHINSGKTYREDFRMALKAAWESAKDAVVGCICEIGRIAQRTLKGMVKMVKAAAEKTAEDVAQILVSKGGKRWTKAGYDRVYFNNANELVGFEVTYYKTGNLSSVKLNGEYLSNCKGRKVLSALDGVYVDLADNSVHYKWSCTREGMEIREMFEDKVSGWLAA